LHNHDLKIKICGHGLITSVSRKIIMGAFGIFGPRTGHKALFYEICSLHNIDSKTRSLLHKIMDKYKSDHPGLIFIDDKYLRKAIDDEDFRSSSELLQELRQKLFQE